jgi:hypothetical protein
MIILYETNVVTSIPVWRDARRDETPQMLSNTTNPTTSQEHSYSRDSNLELQSASILNIF